MRMKVKRYHLDRLYQNAKNKKKYCIDKEFIREQFEIIISYFK